MISSPAMRDHVAAGGRDVLDEHQHALVLLARKVADARVDQPRLHRRAARRIDRDRDGRRPPVGERPGKKRRGGSEVEVLAKLVAARHDRALQAHDGYRHPFLAEPAWNQRLQRCHRGGLCGFRGREQIHRGHVCAAGAKRNGLRPKIVAADGGVAGLLAASRAADRQAAAVVEIVHEPGETVPAAVVEDERRAQPQPGAAALDGGEQYPDRVLAPARVDRRHLDAAEPPSAGSHDFGRATAAGRSAKAARRAARWRRPSGSSARRDRRSSRGRPPSARRAPGGRRRR